MGWLQRIRQRVAPDRTPVLHIASDDGDGPVIILIHGIASSAATFRNVVPLLRDRYRCVSLDLLGFGASPTPVDATYTIEEHVAAINVTIKSLALSAPFVLVGHSLGSLLAARVAAQYPAQVSRLVLVSPPAYLSQSEIGDPRERARMGMYLKAYEFLRGNKDLTMATASTISRVLQLGTALEVTEHNWNPFILSLKNCVESQTTVSDIANVQVPIDVVYGALDPFIASGTMMIIERMRHVTMHRVEANDHLVRMRLAREIVAVIN